ncbi:MAG: Crp/Fnr family transcriptional regulator [Weeksellaceae bacterium]|jgi:CRP/FNR family transcriptional regulator|nr:Crp/Fnr family transcriptional regulator [Weeksellaceae bacterium]MDX9705564.1 Crp/Fnr family transcriptional regulator [Weeksellaceae bacterium]
MDGREWIESGFGGVFEKELLEEIIEISQWIEFKENDILIDFGQYMKSMPLLIKGAIKIMREDFDEGELLLYFLEKGDTCAMTMACCVGNRKSEIRAIAENDGIVAMIPVQKMEEWMGKYKSWRAFVFQSYNNRFNELLSAIDNIAFKHMDERLEDYLIGKSKVNQSQTITQTHQEIAYELNSSRVVISRLLKAMENEGKIKLNRNNIELISG